MKGRCVCGAVTITATSPRDFMHACHCEQCRQWTGSVFVSIAADDDGVSIEGPVRTYRSSDWAERGFCGTCGSSLFYRSIGDAPSYGLCAGLFENAGNLPLRLEYFADMKPDGYAFAGDHTRLTRAETLARFSPDDGEPS